VTSQRKTEEKSLINNNCLHDFSLLDRDGHCQGFLGV